MGPDPEFAAIGLGSNRGDRAEQLHRAAENLADMLDSVAFSRVYETAPVGVPDQPLFLNACCIGRTSLTPEELLDRLKRWEAEAGRRPGGPRWGPRPLDLDILLYGDRRVHEEDLMIPHPRLAERAFALVPLAEIAARWRVPGANATVAELARRVPRVGVRLLEPQPPGWPHSRSPGGATRPRPADRGPEP